MSGNNVCQNSPWTFQLPASHNQPSFMSMTLRQCVKNRRSVLKTDA